MHKYLMGEAVTKHFCFDYKSPGIIKGTNTISRNTAVSPIRYGTTALAIFSIGRPVMPVATNKLIATGGVIIPIAIPTTKRMPKCRVDTPNARTNGRNTGVRIIIAEDVSMKTPAIRIITEIRSMIIYLLEEMLSTDADIASGICQLAKAQPNGPEHEMIIMMTALVLAEPFMISKRPFQVRSR